MPWMPASPHPDIPENTPDLGTTARLNVGGPLLNGGMNSIAAVLGEVAEDLARVLAERVRADLIPGLSDDQLMAVLRAAGEGQRRLDAIVLETVAELEARSAGLRDERLTTRQGCRNTNELLQRVLGVDARDGARIVTGSAAVRRHTDTTSGAPLPARWPALRDALLDGRIGLGGMLAATGPVERAGARISDIDRLRADAELAAHACGEVSDDPDAADDLPGDHASRRGPAATPEDLGILSRVIVTYLDPDGAEPARRRAMRERAVTLGKTRDGLVPLRGALLPEVAGQLQRLFDAYLSPHVDGPPPPGVHFAPSDGELDADEFDTEWEGLVPLDTRTRAQKQHDALAAMLGIAARHDEAPTLGGAAPTLVVSVTAADLVSGSRWAHVDGIDEPVPVSVANHTACAGGVQRVLFDEHGRIVGISTSGRIFTAHQRRAITLRDRECVIPGCHVPATWCEIHHVREHARGGPTHTDNGVALCWFHHHTIDTSEWDIRVVDGLPEIRGPAWWDRERRWRRPRAVSRALAPPGR
ncbi:HNH endonuclease [Actinomycetales bacterium SN12]|nr:HNH endonuclease [Actinomycetales bacterium SN12]